MALKEFYETDPLVMRMITDGLFVFEEDLYGNVFKFKVLNQDDVMEVARAANGYDAMTKFPVMKFETLSRALLSVNGDKIPISPDASECKKFLSKLPDIIVDELYGRYEAMKKTRDLKIQNTFITLKNSVRNQPQEGSGDGSNPPSPSGSATSTQSETP
jgi:hypothetical protein